MARGGSSVLLMGRNPATGKLQPIPVNPLTGALETDAIVTTSLGDIIVLPDDLYRCYDDAAGVASPRTKTPKADFEGIAGVTVAAVRAVQIELVNTNGAIALGAQIGSVKFKTSVISAAFGNAIPLFKGRVESFVDLEAVEVELTLTDVANTRSIITASGRRVS